MTRDHNVGQVNIGDHINQIFTVENLHNRYHISYDIDCSIELDIDVNLLNMVLLSIYKNIVDHAFINMDKEDCKIWIKCQKSDKEIILSFIDNGKGISENIINHVTEPLFQPDAVKVNSV